MSRSAQIANFIDSHVEELIAFRRRMHAHPELSGQETQSTEAILTRLAVVDLQSQVLASGTGLVCDIDPQGLGDGSPLVALRADIDALAMTDESQTQYRSTVPGVAHCCGHDVHTTVVLGAGLLLARLLAAPGAPRGRVRLIFEPAEETVPGGAVEVVDEGHLHGVGAIYGLHCDPKINVGHVGVKSGPITSAADLIEVEISGPGGHTARPEKTVDLISVAARIATEVPRLLSQETSESPLRLVFGSLRAGDAPNVIPSSARLSGTLRTRDLETWQQAPKLFEHALEAVVGQTGARWNISYLRGVPPVVNDAEATATLRAAAVAEFGESGVLETEQSWGGDTFAWYLERVPGSYVRLGVHNPAAGNEWLDLHASTFDVDERAIPFGVRLLAATAMAWLDQA